MLPCCFQKHRETRLLARLRHRRIGPYNTGAPRLRARLIQHNAWLSSPTADIRIPIFWVQSPLSRRTSLSFQGKQSLLLIAPIESSLPLQLNCFRFPLLYRVLTLSTARVWSGLQLLFFLQEMHLPFWLFEGSDKGPSVCARNTCLFQTASTTPGP
jgi:hypothetical protein